MISPVNFSGISNRNYVNNKRTEYKHTVPFKGSAVQEKNIQNSGKKTKRIILTGLALAAGTAIAILSHGKIKACRRTNILKEIPQDLQIRFERLKKLSGKDFVDKSYNEIVDYMGLKGVAPKGISINGSDGVMTITGGYNPMLNTIGYSSGFVKKLTKDQQINMIAHELKHCEQFTNMLRTEGITVEKYVESTVDSYIKNAIKKPVQDVSFYMSYMRAKDAGKVNEFLEYYRTEVTKKLSEDIRQNFADVLKLPKFKTDSPEAKKAFEHLKANSEYEGLNMFGSGNDAYKNNPLEVEAYAYGSKISELFKKFMSA